MDKTQEEIARGEEASRILNHPLVREFFTKAQESIVDSMAQSPLGDEKTHNRLVIALQVLNQIEKSFQEVINTGAQIRVPVGPKTLGRIMNVVGAPIDERGPIGAETSMPAA